MTTELLIIAEAGVNHNGSLGRALEMVDVAAQAGADVIKFQTFSADKLASKDAQLADYQKTSADDSRTQWDLLKGLELSHSDFLTVRKRCEERGIVFLSTGFDIEELKFLVTELSIPMVKIASGDLTFAPMLFEAGRTGLPVILSTGMADLDEIRHALQFIAVGYGVARGLFPVDAEPTLEVREAAWSSQSIRDIVASQVTILHCTTQYPAPLEILNLRAMVTIAETFGVSVGYSDHSTGDLASTVAVSLGARVIEKHFTLDKTLEGPDHAASLDGRELIDFVARLRSVGIALGSAEKACQPGEESNRAAVRRSLVASRAIASGQIIEAEDIGCFRPAGGRTAFDYWELVGTPASKTYDQGDYLE